MNIYDSHNPKFGSKILNIAKAIPYIGGSLFEGEIWYMMVMIELMDTK